MELFNIGIPELVLILLLMLILLGPEGMVKTAQKVAVEIRKFIKSPLWKELLKTQRDIQDLPTNLLREAGINELKEEVQQINKNAQRQVTAAFKPLSGEIPVIQPPNPGNGGLPQLKQDAEPVAEQAPPDETGSEDPSGEDKP